MCTTQNLKSHCNQLKPIQATCMSPSNESDEALTCTETNIETFKQVRKK